MYVFVCFDVEDIVHPDSDDVARDIAEMLADDGIVAQMFVVGEKARLWERRGRWDVIGAVARHDAGLHTDHHSIHPTVSEYLADKGWEDGVAEAMRVEGPAAGDLARIFGAHPTSWATSGSSWAPQIPEATRRLGIPANVYAHARLGETGACWYAGQLCYPDYLHLPGVEDAYTDDAAFEAALPRLLDEASECVRRGVEVVGLFGAHPTRLRYTTFWDALNFNAGQNTAPEDYRFAPRKEDAAYATGLRNLRRMIHAVAVLPDVRMVPLRSINTWFVPQAGPVASRRLRGWAERITGEEAIPAGIRGASPAQMLDLLAQAVVMLSEGRRHTPPFMLTRPVLGPAEPAPEVGRVAGLAPEVSAALCRATLAHIARTGRLPSHLDANGVPVGPAALLRLAAQRYLELTTRERFADRSITAGPSLPAGAEEMVEEAIYKRLPGWPPHRPDLRLDLLAEQTALQCWGLKPATAR